MKKYTRLLLFMITVVLIQSCQKELGFPDVNIVSSPDAGYILGGNPGLCTGATLAGTYQATIVTNALNTATIDVNVNTPGVYSINTNTINGIKFSAAGVFNITGSQTVVLTATGIPLDEGSFDFIINGDTSNCTITIVFATAPARIFSCIIDGTPHSFYVGSTARTDSVAGPSLYISGYSTAVGTLGNFFRFEMYIIKNPQTVIGIGDYDILGNPAYTIDINFTSDNLDGSGITSWHTGSNINSSNPYFTITITSIDVPGGRAAGTFSGTLKDPAPGNTAVREITNGEFNVPVQ